MWLPIIFFCGGCPEPKEPVAAKPAPTVPADYAPDAALQEATPDNAKEPDSFTQPTELETDYD